MVRMITQSVTYQLSEMPNKYNGVDSQNYSHYYPKHLNAEVLLDAVDQLTGAHTDFADTPPGTLAISLPDNSYNKSSNFLKVFGRPEGASVCECERVQSASLAQSLHLMNAADVKQKLATSNGRADLLSKGTQPESEKLRELYLAAFAREPREDEIKIAHDYLAKYGTGSPTATRRAYEDVLWALINTKEFLYNH
jgi:hypothetical protein